MSIFNDLVNIWKKNDLLSQAWDESHEMILLSNKIFIKAIDGLRSGEKTKSDIFQPIKNISFVF